MTDELTHVEGTRRIVHHEEEVMGTIVTFDLYDDTEPSNDVLSLVREAVDLLHEADEEFSTYKIDSPLSRLRRGDVSLEQCSPVIAEVLAMCKMARSVSEGWFDPWSLPGGLDPTGYVKGWAAQRSLDVLRRSNIRGALVNAAGDTACFGGPYLGAPFRIGIVNPAATQYLACVVESPGAVATSGTYERGCHLFDPRTQSHMSRAASATVTGTDLGLADALATALAVAGSRALALLEGLANYEGLVIEFDGTFRSTSDFPIVATDATRKNR